MPRVRSITTDNGSEFLDNEALNAFFRSHGAQGSSTPTPTPPVEKGSVENAIRLVHRWYPQHTDFSHVSTARIAALESTITSIHLKLLGVPIAQKAYHAVA